MWFASALASMERKRFDWRLGFKELGRNFGLVTL